LQKLFLLQFDAQPEITKDGRRNAMKSLNALQPLGLLLLRVTLAIIFIYHGYPKLAHPAGGQQFYIQHGLPGYSLYVSGVLEVFGGALLGIGLFTRAAAVLLTIELGIILWKTYAGGNYFAVGSYELPLTLATACFTLATTGAGAASIDHVTFGGGGRTNRAPNAPKK
jgi:putative oxidoreductase